MDRGINVRGRWPKIYWTGPGSKIDGLHTKKEFIDIMSKSYFDHVYRRMRGDTGVPPGKIKRNDIDGWMAFVNARWVRV
jgi:hypothetical protein